MTPNRQGFLVKLLAQLTWPLPPAIFDALLSIVPTVAIEVQVFMHTMEGPRVLLLPRPENDPFFAGRVHGPGTVMRLGDTELSALTRALGELGGGLGPGDVRFVNRVHVPKGPLPYRCPRGQEIGLLFMGDWPQGTKIPEGVILADPDELPENIIGFHRELVEQAYQAWTRLGPY